MKGVDVAIEDYKKWSKMMKVKFLNDDEVYLLLGSKAKNLIVDGIFTNPIFFKGFDFYCVEVAFKFAKYFDQSVEPNSDVQTFLNTCLNKDATGPGIRSLEKTLKPNLKPNLEWANSSDLRIQIMEDLTTDKFVNNPDLADQLMQTDNKKIIAPSFRVSGNGLPWSDRRFEIEFDDNGDSLGGDNAHGKILEKIRIKLLDKNI
jgi:hypothetical protein